MNRAPGTQTFIFRTYSALFALAIGASASAVEPAAPDGLLVDLLPAPLAVEDLETPRLSWIVRDERRGAVQTAYRIIVATRAELLAEGQADVWDSGKTQGASSSSVPYGGPALEPATRYHWTVRTWNELDQAGSFAEPASFGTALGTTGWQAIPIWAAEEWTDYTVRFDTRIHENAATIWFRAADANNNYMWQFRANTDELAMHTFTGGTFQVEVVPLPFDLQLETNYSIAVEAVGSTIRTFINGNLINETTRTTHGSGRIGFRHGNFEQATYSNLSVVTASGNTLFSSNMITANPFACGTLTPAGVRFGRGERCLLNLPADDLPRTGDLWALLRKDFDVADNPIAHATLYATGISPEPAAQHVYRAEINGGFVGVGPTRGYGGQTMYNAFDVGDRLSPGQNTLAFVAYAAVGKAVQAQLEIVYEDGTRQTIGTDTTWQARTGNDLFLDAGNAGNTTYYVAPREYLRADRWPFGFSTPGFDAAGWKSAIPKPAIAGLTGLGTRNLQQEIRQPVSVQPIGSGAFRLDFGRTVVGGLRLTVDGTKGTQIDIRLGEELNADGTVRFQMRTGNHYRDRWTLADGPQTLEHFGYRVFRYAEVHGLPAAVTPADIVGIGYIYPFDSDAADFTSTNDHLNEVWTFSRDSIRLLNMELYMDTPSRERRAYEADAYLQQLSHYALDREFALARHSTEYLYFNYTWPTEWKLTSPTAAWRDYLHTGDDRSLARHYERLRDTKSVRHFMDSRGLVVKSPGGAHSPDAWTDIIDWPAELRDGYVFSNVNTVINAYNERSLRDLGRIAAVLERGAESAQFMALANQSAAAINEHLFNPATGTYRDGFGIAHHALHASIYPLAFGIATGHEAVAAQALADRRIVGNIFSAAYQVEALFEHGRASDAVDLLTSDDLKSWRNMIKIGAGTTMETWDPSLKGNTTYSHPAGASPVYLIPKGMFGIDALEPAHRRFSVQPRPGDVQKAAIRVPTMSGTIEAAFEVEGESLKFDLHVPANTTAELRLPAAEWWQIREGGSIIPDAAGVKLLKIGNGAVVLEVGGGTYSFVRDPNAEKPGAAGFSGSHLDISLSRFIGGQGAGFTLTGSTHGTVELLPDEETARFTPSAGFTGVATVSFEAIDGSGGTIPGNVNVKVVPEARPQLRWHEETPALEFMSAADETYAIEISEKLTDWSEWLKIKGTGGILLLPAEPETAGYGRFYRVRILP